ncbi:MAG: zinc-dependent alcohol dehydrogenase family protein [Dehalococcoidales bacterium]|nr:zinc-dependent alcohol dehydrogenase family protein [Dehalococcoidales bacterium]
MRAQVLRRIAPIEERPLELSDIPVPRPGKGEILIRVSACGVCHTELDEIEGRLKTKLPVIPGHQIVGRVAGSGAGAKRFKNGDRVGIAWIYSACGQCRFCKEGDENLCAEFRGTGCDADGGYAEYTVVPEHFAFPIPEMFTDAQAAPLLCAGAIGFRDLRLSGIKPGQILGLFGFGASAHIVIQIAKYQGYWVFVFTRGEEHRALAEKLGADWVGDINDRPPQKVDCAIDFTPVGEVIPVAMSVLEKGGRLVIAVIRKNTLIPPMDYASLLWDEKEIKSVANITGKDVEDFLPLAAKIPIIPEVTEFKLEQANEALLLLEQVKIRGAAVLKIR